ncbi:hypothetical protein Tco_1238452 [Tanacetum coccineum]
MITLLLVQKVYAAGLQLLEELLLSEIKTEQAKESIKDFDQQGDIRAFCLRKFSMAFSASELNKTEFTAATYKRGLATVEEQLITYRNNEVLFSEEVAVLKREVACKDYEINVLKNLKSLDLSYSGLDEFKETEFKGYGCENSKQESNIVCDQKSDDSKENSDDFLVKEQVSKDTSSFVESSLNVDKETVFPIDKKDESKELEWTEVQSTRK